MVSSDTYDPARGFGLGCHSGVASASDSESSERKNFPFLDASASRSSESTLLFYPPMRGELLSSCSSSSSGEERVLESSDTTSKVPLRRRPPLVSLASFLAFFSGALYGAGTSNFVSSGMAGSSSSGARHWIRSTFFVQPYRSNGKFNILLGYTNQSYHKTYGSCRTSAVEAVVFGRGRPRFLGL